VNDVSAWLDERLAVASPDLLRAMVKQFAEALMSAEADAASGAGYRERSEQRVNSRNGYRLRDWDTRVGSVELAIPKLRSGSYCPDWLLERRRRAEQASVSAVATSYLLATPLHGRGDPRQSPTGNPNVNQLSGRLAVPIITATAIVAAGIPSRITA
jgi:hypothetical protein